MNNAMWTRITIRMLARYTQIHKVLGDLQVPVLLASPNNELTPPEMIESAARARDTLSGMLMHREARAALKTGITDWLTGTVLMAAGSRDEDDARWAYPAAMLAFDRAGEELDQAVILLHRNEE